MAPNSMSASVPSSRKACGVVLQGGTERESFEPPFRLNRNGGSRFCWRVFFMPVPTRIESGAGFRSKTL